MINNAVLVLGIQQNDSVIHTCVSILFKNVFPFRLLHTHLLDSYRFLKTGYNACIEIESVPFSCLREEISHELLVS